MAAYTVVAPYVTLPVKDANGAKVLVGFYTGGTVADPIEGDVLDKHLRNGWVVPFEEATDEPEGPPAKSASKGDWEAYARSQGATDEDLEGVTKDDLVATYGD